MSVAIEMMRPIRLFERFCNAVAAAALMPSDWLLREHLVVQKGAQKSWRDDELEALAARFGVSQEAVLRRLLTLGRTTQAFYDSRRSVFQKLYDDLDEKKETSDGGPKYHLVVLRPTWPHVYSTRFPRLSRPLFHAARCRGPFKYEGHNSSRNGKSRLRIGGITASGEKLLHRYERIDCGLVRALQAKPLSENCGSSLISLSPMADLYPHRWYCVNAANSARKNFTHGSSHARRCSLCQMKRYKAKLITS